LVYWSFVLLDYVCKCAKAVSPETLKRMQPLTDLGERVRGQVVVPLAARGFVADQ